MMHDRISELLGIVREEIEITRDLLENARQKTKLLIDGRVEAILEANKTDETLSHTLQFLERRLVRLGQELVPSSGITRETFTLTQLADLLGNPLAREIRNQAAILRNIMTHLQSINERNMRLIDSSLNYSKGMLALLSNASGSYKKSGSFDTVPTVTPAFSQRV
jgi:flagellar biosynthesis/type III secretory pathway chaperone